MMNKKSVAQSLMAAVVCVMAASAGAETVMTTDTFANTNEDFAKFSARIAEMNGRNLAKNLLALYPHLKCLFMSGYTADVIAHHGVVDDGVCFIQKPFSKSMLAAKIRDTLDNGKG